MFDEIFMIEDDTEEEYPPFEYSLSKEDEQEIDEIFDNARRLKNGKI